MSSTAHKVGTSRSDQQAALSGNLWVRAPNASHFEGSHYLTGHDIVGDYKVSRPCEVCKHINRGLWVADMLWIHCLQHEKHDSVAARAPPATPSKSKKKRLNFTQILDIRDFYRGGDHIRTTMSF